MERAPAFLLGSALLPALNHLLHRSRWARARLSPFSGQTVGVSMGDLRFGLIVTEQGDFAAHADALEQDDATVRIAFPAETAAHLLQDLLSRQKPDLWREAWVSGNVAFAEALSFVFRNLNWDVEADLALLTGDAAARCLVSLGKSLQARLLQVGENLEQVMRGQCAARLVGTGDRKVLNQALEILQNDVAALSARVDFLAVRLACRA